MGPAPSWETVGNVTFCLMSRAAAYFGSVGFHSSAIWPRRERNSKNQKGEFARRRPRETHAEPVQIRGFKKLSACAGRTGLVGAGQARTAISRGTSSEHEKGNFRLPRELFRQSQKLQPAWGRLRSVHFGGFLNLVFVRDISKVASFQDGGTMFLDVSSRGAEPVAPRLASKGTQAWAQKSWREVVERALTCNEQGRFDKTLVLELARDMLQKQLKTRFFRNTRKL